MGIRVSFGKALKAKTLLIVRLQGFIRFVSHFCDPAGIRTQDHYIKSVMLYQLSYGIFLVLKNFFVLRRCKYRNRFNYLQIKNRDML